MRWRRRFSKRSRRCQQGTEEDSDGEVEAEEEVRAGREARSRRMVSWKRERTWSWVGRGSLERRVDRDGGGVTVREDRKPRLSDQLAASWGVV